MRDHTRVPAVSVLEAQRLLRSEQVLLEVLLQYSRVQCNLVEYSAAEAALEGGEAPLYFIL